MFNYTFMDDDGWFSPTMALPTSLLSGPGTQPTSSQWWEAFLSGLWAILSWDGFRIRKGTQTTAWLQYLQLLKHIRLIDWWVHHIINCQLFFYKTTVWAMASFAGGHRLWPPNSGPRHKRRRGRRRARRRRSRSCGGRCCERREMRGDATWQITGGVVSSVVWRLQYLHLHFMLEAKLIC